MNMEAVWFVVQYTVSGKFCMLWKDEAYVNVDVDANVYACVLFHV